MIDLINNLPKLPIGWINTKLREISEIILGQSPPSSTYNENQNGLPFYQGKLEFGELHPTPRKWCTSPKKVAEQGDILLSVRAPVGPTNICPNRSCIGRGLAAIRPLGNIPSLFILYTFRSFEDELSTKGTGTTFSAISGDQIRSINVPFAPLPEQHRIVAKIEELFTRLDAGLEALRKIKAQLKQYRQAVLKYAFEGKLTEEWREAHKYELEPSSVLMERVKEERRSKANGKVKELPLLDTAELPELPEGWVWARVGDIAYSIQYGYTASSVKEPVGPKMLRITDIQNDVVDWDTVPFCKIDNDEKYKYQLREGDLVFARTGATVGKSFLLSGEFPESVFASYLIRIILASYTSHQYVYDYFHSNAYWSQIYQGQLGIGQPNVNSQILSRIILPIPPENEQKQILAEIERHLSIADEIEKTIDQSLQQSESLRQSILKRAFEGKLVPQDPNDEPAEVLLQRIKTEKATQETEGKPHKRTRIKVVKAQGRLI